MTVGMEGGLARKENGEGREYKSQCLVRKKDLGLLNTNHILGPVLGKRNSLAEELDL